MKRSYFLVGFALLTILSFLNSCRKEEARTFNNTNTISELPFYCHNGVMDGDEAGVDCGGSCTACSTVTAPCSPADNHGTSNSTNLTFTSVTCGQDLDGYAYIRGYVGGDYVTITIPQFPFTSRTWNLNNTGAFFDEAGLLYYHNFYNHWATGEIYINVSGSSVSVDFCSLSASGMEGFTEVTYTLTGNLTCN